MKHQVEPIDRAGQLHSEQHIELLPDMGWVEWSQTDGEAGNDQHSEGDLGQEVSHHGSESIADDCLYNQRPVFLLGNGMKTLSTLLLLLVVVGCASTGTEPPVAAGENETEPAELTESVHWMRNSAEYRAVMEQTYALASERLRTLVADKDSGTWAVASDADETIIDNSPYAKDLLLSGQELTAGNWDAWVARRAAPPLPGAVEFLELVRQLGGHIAIVTNRKAEHCADTRANFMAFDIPFDVILCREDDRRKEPRWEMVAAGTASRNLPPLEIVLWLGDNIEDFPGLDQDIRQQDAAAFGEFGYRFFAVPNPTYGSWEENPQD